MTDDSVFGPDRDDEPGIYPVPGSKPPPQIINLQVESCAMHSPSQGWMPGVRLGVATDDGAAMIGVLRVGPEIETFIGTLREASRRARRDLAIAVQKGQLPT